MAITQMVDDQIKQLREERAELEKKREDLERREEEIKLRESLQNDEVGAVDERKESLLKEVNELTEELARLRAERDSSIDSFGGEITKVHEEKQAENTAQIKQLQSEINFLLKGKAELEEDIAKLATQTVDMEEKARNDTARIHDEKEAAVKRAREESETELKEITLAHSLAVAEMANTKKELENEIAALEQNKTIEWNKVEAEVARYKTTQLGEVDVQREEMLTELERERSSTQDTLRAQERKQTADIAAEKREWEKEILNFEVQKQKILDEIKLMEYDFEKIRAEGILNVEKARMEDEKKMEAYRAEVLAKIEEEASLASTQSKKDIADEKRKLLAEVAQVEKEILECEAKKATVLSDITALNVKFDAKKAENAAELEAIRLDRLKGIDEERVNRLRQIEDLRQERIASLEKAFLDKMTILEAARSDKLEEVLKSIESAEGRHSKIMQEQVAAQNEIETLRVEAAKIREENESSQRAASMAKQFELEKMINDKLAQVDEICTSRLEAAAERARKIEDEGTARDEKLSADIAASTETLLELRRMINAQEIEMQHLKDEKLDEIEKKTIKAMESLSKMKEEKLAEIDDYLQRYKDERLRSIHEDAERLSKMDLKSVEELAQLNADYSKRMASLQELSMTVETDMRAIEFKNKQISMLQQRNMEVEMFLAQRDAYDSGIAAAESANMASSARSGGVGAYGGSSSSGRASGGGSDSSSSGGRAGGGSSDGSSGGGRNGAGSSSGSSGGNGRTGGGSTSHSRPIRDYSSSSSRSGGGYSEGNSPPYSRADETADDAYGTGAGYSSDYDAGYASDDKERGRASKEASPPSTPPSNKNDRTLRM